MYNKWNENNPQYISVPTRLIGIGNFEIVKINKYILE